MSETKVPLAKPDSFFDTLNPIIMLLDPHLHTFDYIRERSAFLCVRLTRPELTVRFTAILLAAARFINPSLVITLTEVVKECLVEAILGSHRSIETVQSWMIVRYPFVPHQVY